MFDKTGFFFLAPAEKILGKLKTNIVLNRRLSYSNSPGETHYFAGGCLNHSAKVTVDVCHAVTFLFGCLKLKDACEKQKCTMLNIYQRS